MFPTTLNGVPTHPLLVHAVVVLVPLTALLVVLAAVWPAAARRLGWVPAVLAVVTLGSIPLTTQAGEWLERRVAPTPLVAAHTAIADDLLPWQVAVTVLAIGLLVLRRMSTRAGAVTPATDSGRSAGDPTGAGAGADSTGGAGRVAVTQRASVRTAPAWVRPVTAVVAVLAVVAAVGSVVEVYRIGESGARAVWQGQVSANPAPRPHHRG